jgi:outer membrane protein assembly factor BamB
MPGANIGRTSWVSEQVDGALTPLWYKKFEPYICANTQVITAYDTLYIATSAGLYAIDSETGASKWDFPTTMPVGNSPAVDNGVVYFGGFDRKLYALDAFTGQELWTYQGDSNFYASPLVINGIVYIGNRDGKFYAVQWGEKIWDYQTDGPIDIGAAYDNGKVYFASNDSYAYALNLSDGSLYWKSSKLPGLGFRTWWPVVYGNYVIFSGTHGYMCKMLPGGNGTFYINYSTIEQMDVYPHQNLDPRNTPVGPMGHESGDWLEDTCTMDLSRPMNVGNGDTLPPTEYLSHKPWRRTYIVLNKTNGVEYTTDFDNDSVPEYAPILWQGTQSGWRHPPVVGSDGVIYQGNCFIEAGVGDICGGNICGWKIGTPFISIPNPGWIAMDEPVVMSGGGNRIYWNLCNDRECGSFDLSKLNTSFPPAYEGTPAGNCCDDLSPVPNFDPTQAIRYWSYDLNAKIPNYDDQYYALQSPPVELWGAFGSDLNGAYGETGNQSPPIPYHGRLYMIRANTLIVLAPYVATPVEITMEDIDTPVNIYVPAPTIDDISDRLDVEINKMIVAGHLLPAYYNAGFMQSLAGDAVGCGGCEDRYAMGYYFRNPADTIYTLIRALPYLTGATHTATLAYIQSEFAAYPVYSICDIGWDSGSDRVPFSIPADVLSDRHNYPPETTDTGYGWTYDPFGFYALWQYALQFGGALALYNASSSRLLHTVNKTDAYLQMHVEALNSYLVGYDGFLKLQTLAGVAQSADVIAELARLKTLRSSTFTKDIPDTHPDPADVPWHVINYCRGLNIARNFMYLTPELGQYLHDNALAAVQTAISEYELVAPYWFVGGFDESWGESATAEPYHLHGLFQAKSLILQRPWYELAKYLDEPFVHIGDLYYIDNLVSTLYAHDNF